jgi:D-alanyl-D-alanine carboxypeptidase (penicillin-binding protein 5/6)
MLVPALLGVAVLGVEVGAGAPAAENGAAHIDAASDTLGGLPAAPAVNAAAWAVYDGTDGQVLAGSNIDTPRPIASLTKLMTAKLVLDHTQGQEQVPTGADAQAAGDGSEIDMHVGQKYKVDTLLDAMLAYSANDAAVALADYVGTTQPGFIAQMNAEAAKLGMSNTHYTTVNGLDAPQLTESTPADLVSLATVDMQDPRFRAAVRIPDVVVARPGDSTEKLTNRNLLLGSYTGVDGVKTGFTNHAGYCLLTHWTDPAHGATDSLYVVVLGEKTAMGRFTDTRALLDWARPLRQRLQIDEAGAPVVTVPVAGGGSVRRLTLYLSDDLAPSLRVGQRLSERVTVPDVLNPPLHAGDEVGSLQVLADGKVVAHSALYTEHGVRSLTRGQRIRRYLRDWRVAAREGWRYSSHEARRFVGYLGL